MKRRMILSMLVIALAFAAIGAGTMAYFTDQATSTNNTFATGDLEITLTEGTWDHSSAHFDLGNMAPGDEFTTTMTIANTGDYEVEVTAQEIFNAVAGQVDLRPALTVTSSFSNNTDTVILAAGDSDTYTISVVWTPGANDNDYQNGGATLSYQFDAIQTANR